MKLNVYRDKHKMTIPGPDQLEEAFTVCPFCGSNRIRSFLQIQEIPEIRAMTCLNCFIGFIDRQPTEQFLKEFYAGYYTSSHKHTTIDPELMASHLIRSFRKLSNKNTLSVLDFGGGDGSVSMILADRMLRSGMAAKVKICVIDYHETEVEARELVHKTSYPTLESVPEDMKFDIVIASAILEHVKTPGETIRSLLSMLEKGGFFYARTPFMYPVYRGLSLIGIHMDLPYPAHLFDMGSRFWNRSLNTLNLPDNFRLERSRTSLVESRFRKNPLRTVIACLLKLPSRILVKSYPFVGGWEVVIKKGSRDEK